MSGFDSLCDDTTLGEYCIGTTCSTATDCYQNLCTDGECADPWNEFSDAAGKAVTVWIIMVVLFCLCIIGYIVCCVCGIGFCAAKGAQAAANDGSYQRSE